MTATDPIRTTRKTKVKVKSTADALKVVADHAAGKEQLLYSSGSSLKMDMSNLTGGQIQEVLDFLILNSLRPIIEASDIFNVQLAYLLTLTAQNRKRKLSSLPRAEFMSLMSRALLTRDRTERYELISGAKIERSFLYNFVVKFLHHARDYKATYVAFLRSRPGYERDRLESKLKVLETALTLSRDKMLPALHLSQDYLDMSYSFRNSIVENYIKKTGKQARAFVQLKGDNFDVNDVRQNFLTAVTKAIDKYDSSKGAITSYINFWVLNAQSGSESDHEYGIAFTIPQLQRKKLAMGSKGDVNFSVSLEGMMRGGNNNEEYGVIDTIQGDIGIEQSRINSEDLQTTRMLIKQSDPSSLARLYLDIEETFTSDECMAMARNMISEGLTVPADVLARLKKSTHKAASKARPAAASGSQKQKVQSKKKKHLFAAKP